MQNTYNNKPIIIGGSLEALEYAVRVGYPIVCARPIIPRDPELFARWHRVNTVLTLQGGLIGSSVNINTIAIEDDKKQIIIRGESGDAFSKVYEKLYIFDDRRIIAGLPVPLSKNEKVADLTDVYVFKRKSKEAVGFYPLMAMRKTVSTTIYPAKRYLKRWDKPPAFISEILLNKITYEELEQIDRSEFEYIFIPFEKMKMRKRTCVMCAKVRIKLTKAQLKKAIKEDDSYDAQEIQTFLDRNSESLFPEYITRILAERAIASIRNEKYCGKITAERMIRLISQVPFSNIYPQESGNMVFMHGTTYESILKEYPKEHPKYEIIFQCMERPVEPRRRRDRKENDDTTI